MRFDLQPHLVGDLVELRPLGPADWRELYGVASDPLIWEQHPASDRWKEPYFKEFFQEALDYGGAFAVIDRGTGAIIGSTQFRAFEPDPEAIEIGWTFLARSHWGGRCNREMKRLMLEHAFNFVPRVVFVVGENNIRSQTAVLRLGAQRSQAIGPGGLVVKTNRHGQVVRSYVFVLERPG